MKHFLITLLILIGIAGVAVVTCPDKTKHVDSILAVANQSINGSIRKEMKGESEEELAMATYILGGLGNKFVKFALDTQLDVENHFVYSTGVFHNTDGDNMVSLGIFGHVFTISHEELDKLLEE